MKKRKRKQTTIPISTKVREKLQTYMEQNSHTKKYNLYGIVDEAIIGWIEQDIILSQLREEGREQLK